jgi:hypothetical protein
MLSSPNSNQIILGSSSHTTVINGSIDLKNTNSVCLTPSNNDNSKKIVNSEFVNTAINNFISGSLVKKWYYKGVSGINFRLEFDNKYDFYLAGDRDLQLKTLSGTKQFYGAYFSSFNPGTTTGGTHGNINQTITTNYSPFVITSAGNYLADNARCITMTITDSTDVYNVVIILVESSNHIMSITKI